MQNYVEITSEPRAFRLNLAELWRSRYLVYLLTRKTFVLSYKQTILGPLWLLFTPLLYSVIHSIIFGRVAGISTNGVPQFLYYLCSNSFWGFFSSCINRNANIFRDNQGLFGKVYFSRLTVPVSNILVSLITFCIQIIPAVLYTVVLAVKGTLHPLWPGWLLLPLIMLHLALLGLSVGLLSSSLTAKYRDFSILLSVVMMVWMYLSPVIYPLSQLTEGWIRSLVLLNPVTAPVELARKIILGAGSFEPLSLLLSCLITAGLLVISIAVFHRLEQNYMDTV